MTPITPSPLGKFRGLATGAALLLTLALGAFAHGDKKHTTLNAASLETLYASYLEIQSALAKDDLKAAQQAGKAFLKKPLKLPQELSHSVTSMEMLKDIKGINQAKDLAEGRKAFTDFSDHMILVMSENGYAGKAEAFEFFCPMANGNKGAHWVQSDKKIANPYFGSKMRKCGEMKKDLKAGDGKDSEADARAPHHAEG